MASLTRMKVEGSVSPISMASSSSSSSGSSSSSSSSSGSSSSSSSNVNVVGSVRCQRFVGKLAVVTASTAGIGLAISRRLAQEGAEVVISSRKPGNVEKAVKQLRSEGLNIRGIPCHVANESDRNRLLKFATENGSKIDVLVSNAAVNPAVGVTLDTTSSQFDKLFEVNVKAGFMLVKHAMEFMQEGGSVLIVSSATAYEPNTFIGMYAVTKTALLGLTKALAKDLWRYKKIRVNCLAPGIIRTDFSHVLWENRNSTDIVQNGSEMGRIGEPEEMAGPAAFLCSDDASYITAEVMVAAGGSSGRL